MAYKVFIDTNIIVDFLQPVRPFYKDAHDLFMHLYDNNIIAFTSESVITTTVYLIQKDYSVEKINQLIKSLNQRLKILACTNQLISYAVGKNPPDFEDALLYEIALHNQLDYFITSNIKDFKKIQQPGLPVIRAKELNKILANSFI